MEVLSDLVPYGAEPPMEFRLKFYEPCTKADSKELLANVDMLISVGTAEWTRDTGTNLPLYSRSALVTKPDGVIVLTKKALRCNELPPTHQCYTDHPGDMAPLLAKLSISVLMPDENGIYAGEIVQPYSANKYRRTSKFSTLASTYDFRDKADPAQIAFFGVIGKGETLSPNRKKEAIGDRRTASHHTMTLLTNILSKHRQRLVA